MSRNNLTESVNRYILLYSWWGNSIRKSNLYKSQSPPFTILKWQSNNREQINKAGNLIWRDPKNMDVWGDSLFKHKLQLHNIFWFTIYSLPQSSWHNSHSHASTGIKFYSCPPESYILVYQATIWSWNKLYLRQRDTVRRSCYERDGPLNLSAAPQKGMQLHHHQLLMWRLTDWLLQLLFICYFIQYTRTMWLITPFL